MTVFEGLTLVHLFITLFLAYKLGQLTTEIDTLYEGVALCMKEVGLGVE